ncbi:MAG TPA: hypothetical protein VFV38_25550 [Ktedonobacteraceae bacterium]|nr:hypothetical protein [Ktedonobacteraceae bacterium]
MDWQHFRDFLRELGVEMEEGEIPEVSTRSDEPPTFTLLQHSRDHEAFYRVDLIDDTKPELLVLIPTSDNPLRFHFYLVQPSSTHPLFGSLDRVAANRQGLAMEIHEAIEWHTLQAIIETMKALFWAGLETARFSHEIVVYKLL